MMPKIKTSNIILIGMPGSGKTTLGAILAERLEYKFIDTDQLISERTGKTPRQLVENSGREYFQKIQDEVVLAIKQDNSIISTGGGLVHSDIAMNYLKSIGFVIYLKTKYETIEERMDPSRKLIRNNGTLLDLYNERLPLYNFYADAILDCDCTDPQLLSNRIIKILCDS